MSIRRNHRLSCQTGTSFDSRLTEPSDRTLDLFGSVDKCLSRVSECLDALELGPGLGFFSHESKHAGHATDLEDLALDGLSAILWLFSICQKRSKERQYTS